MKRDTCYRMMMMMTDTDNTERRKKVWICLSDVGVQERKARERERDKQEENEGINNENQPSILRLSTKKTFDKHRLHMDNIRALSIINRGNGGVQRNNHLSNSTESIDDEHAYEIDDFNDWRSSSLGRRRSSRVSHCFSHENSSKNF